MLHPVVSETFDVSNDDQSTTPMQLITTDEISAITSSSQPSANDAFVTEALATVTSEMKHQLEILRISTNSVRVSFDDVKRVNIKVKR